MTEIVAARQGLESSSSATERFLARRPGVGFWMFLVGTLIFSALYWGIKLGAGLNAWDVAVVNWFHAWAVHSSPFVRWLMLTGSFIGQDGLLALNLALAVVWVFRRDWFKVLMLLVGTAGCEVAYQVLGALINRHRPVFADPIEVLTGPGFPSGHTAVGLAFFGLLGYLLWPHLKTRWQRYLVAAVVVLLLLYISVSRLFQGVHYPTDLLAGFALGLAWSGMVYTPLEVAARGPRQPSAVSRLG